MKKSKKEVKQLQEQLNVKKQKKKKSKKHRKENNVDGKKISLQKSVKQQKLQQNIPSVDSIALQLSQLTFTQTLSPNFQACGLINQKLQELTLNLLQKMIMKESLIYSAIRIAKSSKLTPKEYFYLDYTNKLTLISKLLDTCPRKYGKFKQQVEEEITRAENLIIRSIDDIRIVDEVFQDLVRTNVEWEINKEAFDECQRV